MAVVGYLDGYVDENNREYGLTDTVAQGSITAIKDGSSIDSFGDVETALAGKADEFDVDGWTIDWQAGAGVPNKLYVMEHDEIPREGAESSGLPNDEAIRKAVGSAYNLMKDTAGWTGLNKLPYTIEELKTANKNGTWVDNVYTLQNVSFTVNDDMSITVVKSGELTSESIAFNFSNYKKFLETGKSYKLKGCDGGSRTTYKYDLLRETGAAIIALCYEGEVTFTETADNNKARIVVYKTASDFTTTIKPMIYDASILSPTYEPYRGTTAFPRDEQAVLGAKNLLPVENFQGDINGITYNIADGIVNMSGTSTAATGRVFGNFTFKGGVTYYLSGNPSNNANIWIGVYNTSTTRYEYVQSANTSNVVAIKYDEDTTRRINIRVGSGETVTNLQMKPMIALSSDEIFAPYAMTNRELTENKLSISELKSIAADAADFAAFKTAIANL